MKMIVTAIVMSLTAGVATAEAGNGKRNRVIGGKAKQHKSYLKKNPKVGKKSWEHRSYLNKNRQVPKKAYESRKWLNARKLASSVRGLAHNHARSRGHHCDPAKG